MTLPLGPLTFTPVIKQIIWGGRRLGEQLGKSIGAGDDYAESWELVDRAADQSVVESGPLAGQTLANLIATHGSELMGRHAGQKNFPLLLKYLDCQRVLSVQVHPADEYALQMAKPDLGKTEAWYILEAAPNSVIYAGLKAGVDRAELSAAMLAGRTDEVLHSFHPLAGQCLFIPAGTVHALGDGLLVAEVQQSSDTTFRLFDWNRVGADGKPRVLHIEQALEVTDYKRGPVNPQSTVEGADGWEVLVTCDKFSMRQASSKNTARGGWVTGGNDSPVVLMVTSGQAVIQGTGWEPVQLLAGQTVLLPASVGETCLALNGEATNVLEIGLPSTMP